MNRLVLAVWAGLISLFFQMGEPTSLCGWTEESVIEDSSILFEVRVRRGWAKHFVGRIESSGCKVRVRAQLTGAVSVEESRNLDKQEYLDLWLRLVGTGVCEFDHGKVWLFRDQLQEPGLWKLPCFANLGHPEAYLLEMRVGEKSTGFGVTGEERTSNQGYYNVTRILFDYLMSTELNKAYWEKWKKR